MSLHGIKCLTDRRRCDGRAGSRACHCVSGAREREREAGRQAAGSRGREVERRCFCLYAGVPTGVGRGGRVGLAVLHRGGCGVGRVYGGLGGVQVGLFLKLADIFLVADPFVAKPVGHLCGASRGEARGSQTSRSHST